MQQNANNIILDATATSRSKSHPHTQTALGQPHTTQDTHIHIHRTPRHNASRTECAGAYNRNTLKSRTAWKPRHTCLDGARHLRRRWPSRSRPFRHLLQAVQRPLPNRAKAPTSRHSCWGPGSIWETFSIKGTCFVLGDLAGRLVVGIFLARRDMTSGLVHFSSFFHALPDPL